MDDVMPKFSARWLTEGRSECPQDVEIQGRRYRVYGNLIRSEDEHTTLLLATLYLVDMTELFNVRDNFFRTRPIVSVILVDNYDELTKNLSEGAVSKLNAKINDAITQWTDEYHGLLRRLERNRFLFIFEKRELSKAIEEKFNV